MKLYDSENIQLSESTAVTLGNFDGVHIGHQKLINTVKEFSEKENLKSVVFSFYPHPVSVIKNTGKFYVILSPDEKKYVIKNMGADILIQYPFTKDFADMDSESFMKLLYEKTKCKILVVGEDYSFGKNKMGTYDTLKYYGDYMGIKVIKIPSVNDEGIKVSSSRIRKCISDKNFDEANRLLNRPYFILGKIVEGKRLGRKMGFPTINIIPPKDKLLPPDGVYLTKTAYGGKILNSITNVGKNPTVNDINRRIETYIFDFNSDIYGKEVRICFYKAIRDEIKFNSIEELKTQINSDKQKAIEMFNNLVWIKP